MWRWSWSWAGPKEGWVWEKTLEMIHVNTVYKQKKAWGKVSFPPSFAVYNTSFCSCREMKRRKKASMQSVQNGHSTGRAGVGSVWMMGSYCTHWTAPFQVWGDLEAVRPLFLIAVNAMSFVPLIALVMLTAMGEALPTKRQRNPKQVVAPPDAPRTTSPNLPTLLPADLHPPLNITLWVVKSVLLKSLQ